MFNVHNMLIWWKKDPPVLNRDKVAGWLFVLQHEGVNVILLKQYYNNFIQLLTFLMKWHNDIRMGRPVTQGGIYSARFFIAKTWGWLIMTIHKNQCNTVKHNMILCLSLFAENSKDEREAVNASLCYWQGGALMWPFSIQCLLNKKCYILKKTKNCCPGPLKALFVENSSQKWDVTLGEQSSGCNSTTMVEIVKKLRSRHMQSILCYNAALYTDCWQKQQSKLPVHNC